METFGPIERFLAAGLHLSAALIWAILAHSFFRSHGTVRPRDSLLQLFRVLCTILAAHYGFNALADLTFATAAASAAAHLVACELTRMTTIAMLPVFRHLIPLGNLGSRPPSRLWLALNYGPALLIALLVAPDSGWANPAAMSITHLYLLIMTAAILWDLLRLSRTGWRPLLMADLRFAGFLLLGLALFSGVVTVVLTEPTHDNRELGWVLAHTFVGVAAATPFAVRILGEVSRRFVGIALRFAVALVVYFGAAEATERLTDPDLRRLVDLTAVLALVLLLSSRGARLRSAVDRLVQRRHRHSDPELETFLRTLSPRLGVAECCQRASDEIAGVLGLDGAGILLDRPATGEVHGGLDLGAVARVWPRGGPDSETIELPEGAFDLLWLQDPELQTALYESKVTWVVPILSPRRRWGHLFVAAGYLGTADGDAKLTTLESFTRRLALILDAADLLARSVSAERELAQAEKLAALGETAARIAHEIRNPLTAARSLTQLLAEEPTSPLNAEHAGLVVRELDRVERQVRSLLQFARPETYAFERVALADLVGAIAGDLATLLEKDALELEVDLAAEVTVDADPERLRQVLINLVNNAVDALAETPPPRRLKLALHTAPGGATLTVADSGPGVEEDLLPRLFEPFVSHKTQGTGLGLAVAKRIVEAHGGRIEAARGRRCGMVFRIWLPVAEGRVAQLPAALQQAV